MFKEIFFLIQITVFALKIAIFLNIDKIHFFLNHFFRSWDLFHCIRVKKSCLNTQVLRKTDAYVSENSLDTFFGQNAPFPKVPIISEDVPGPKVPIILMMVVMMLVVV